MEHGRKAHVLFLCLVFGRAANGRSPSLFILALLLFPLLPLSFINNLFTIFFPKSIDLYLKIIYNNKGYVSKKGEDKKSHQSKWGTTGNKMSDLVTNIILNVTLPERYELIEKSMKILNDYTTPLGFYFRTIYTNERR